MAIDINVPSQVKNYANLAAFPATGSLKTIFIAEDTNKTYRWTGSVYVEISQGSATPTLDQVTTAGNTTTNRIAIGGATTNGSVTATSLLARGNYFNNTLVASANNDVLVGLDISPTFTNGAFTGVTNYAIRFPNAATNYIYSQGSLRFQGGTAIFDGGISSSQIYVNTILTNGGNLQLKGASNTTYGTMFQSTGNLLLQNGGTFTDAGYRLDVNGTARVQGDTYLSAGGLGIGTSSLTTTSLNLAKTITGGTTSYGFQNQGVIQSGVTGTAVYSTTYAQTVASAFTLGTINHYHANQGVFGAGSTVQIQNGFLVNAALIGATNNYGFRGQIPTGSNRWNLYMDGTASNYLAGNLLLGTTTNGASKLRVVGLPTSSAGLSSGDVWNNLGILTIV
jgi:hypothetical protein